MSERSRRKRKLIVRDWFYYVVWFVRLRNIRRNLYSEPVLSSALNKLSLSETSELMKAATGGVSEVKAFLQQKRKEQSQAALKQKLKSSKDHSAAAYDEDDFNYNYIKVAMRVEDIEVKFFEKSRAAPPANLRQVSSLGQ